VRIEVVGGERIGGVGEMDPNGGGDVLEGDCDETGRIDEWDDDPTSTPPALITIGEEWTEANKLVIASVLSLSG
jgi:hypothetical protein